jgi:hypothetical protein
MIKASERIAVGYVNPRTLQGSIIKIDERPPLIKYLADRMARVVTPYWPCSDLKWDA